MEQCTRNTFVVVLPGNGRVVKGSKMDRERGWREGEGGEDREREGNGGEGGRETEKEI